MKLRRARARARFPLARCGGFDAVVTCFFIDCVDTARALEVIAGCLREGGAWINLGPVGTAQLNWRECARIAECLGFAFEIDEVRPLATSCLLTTHVRACSSGILSAGSDRSEEVEFL